MKKTTWFRIISAVAFVIVCLILLPELSNLGQGKPVDYIFGGMLLLYILSRLFLPLMYKAEQKELEIEAVQVIKEEKHYYQQKITDEVLQAYKADMAKTDEVLTKAIETTEKADNEDSISYLARCMREAEKEEPNNR